MSLLAGCRILAVEQYGAGPFGTSYLAALGAEVIKIEQPEEGGDVSRHVGPHFDDRLSATARSLFYQSLNVGKKSITLSLRQPEGRALLRRLVPGAHAVVSNLRGDVPGKLGLTHEHLKDVNPAIVCGHLTGYGRSGERAHWPGYDFLMQAEAGYFSLTGEPDSAPARMGLSMVDYMTGVVFALGVVSGVLSARTTGAGCDVDVSLYDVALHNLNYLAAWYLNAGAETTRLARSAHPSLSPCQLYSTKDGWIYLMCNKEKFWPILCEKIGRPGWAELPRFKTFADRFASRDELTAMLDDALSARTTAGWMEIFAGSVPASPVQSVSQALDSGFSRSEGRIASFSDATGQRIDLVRHPLRSSKDAGTPAAAPALGAHNRDVFREIGIDADELESLRQRGVV